MDFAQQIRSEDELRALYRDPSDIVKGKVADHLNDAAQGLYERCGFGVFGIEPFAIRVGEDYVSKVHMWCNLHAN